MEQKLGCVVWKIKLIFIYLFFIIAFIWGISAIFNALSNNFSLMAVNILLAVLFLIIGYESKNKLSNKKDTE